MSVGELLLVGATGDLSQRMLLPALFALHRDDLLPNGLRITGLARRGLDVPGFRALAAGAIGTAPAAAVSSFVDRLGYTQVGDDLAGALGGLEPPPAGGRLIHLSVAPELYQPACAALSAAGLTAAPNRLMVEKPIGHDRASAVAVNASLADAFDEARLFRVDHYLGKEGVQNLLALRFGNSLFEPLWNAHHIDHVQITVAETIGIEGRAGYYDGAGALRDMVQNHVLQLLCLIAMEPPAAFTPEAVRDEKVKVLRSLRPVAAGEAVAGQYGAGAIGAAAVPAYQAEGGASGTETFVAIKAHIDNWRWAGVPLYIRTGKRLAGRRSEIVVQFKSLPHAIFAPASGAAPNRLVVQLQPDERVQLEIVNKVPGLDRDGVRVAPVALDLSLDAAFTERRRIAYERLYLDALEGRGTLFVRGDEVEAAWAWIDGIRDLWGSSGERPRPYAAGTWGPSAAIGLAERHGHSWRE